MPSSVPTKVVDYQAVAFGDVGCLGSDEGFFV